MRILLTFAGARDPFNPDGLIEGQSRDGPVLALLKEESFGKIYLFTDGRLLGRARELEQEIKQRYRPTKTSVIELDLANPTDYEAIFYHLNQHSRAIQARHAHKDPCYFISTASGTPQMQTVWFLLARSGLLPARLLKVTDPHFLSAGERSVSEIKLSLAEFPTVSPGEVDALELASLRIQREQWEAEREALFKEVEAEGIIGTSPGIQTALTKLLKAAPTNHPVLISGETGTGKELFAKAIHRRSKRVQKPYISVNCAAIPDTLIESELFGHEKGAYTGAISATRGKFELANGGTLFLDEVGDLSSEAQAKVLRALETGEIEKVGSREITRVDVRVLAATHWDLRKRTAEGIFREDLYYRLNVIPLHLPPLRERLQDIPRLIEHFLRRLPPSDGGGKRLDRQALKRLMDYPWPGNIRQLENTIKQMATLSEGRVITADDIPQDIILGSTIQPVKELDVMVPAGGMDLNEFLAALEKAYFQKAIRLKEGNQAAAARLLGFAPHTFRKRAHERFGLSCDKTGQQ